MKKELLLLVAIFFVSMTCCGGDYSSASLVSQKKSKKPLEGLIISISSDGKVSTDSGTKFDALNELEKFIEKNKNIFSPVLLIDTEMNPENLLKAMKILKLFQRSAASYSLIVE